MKDYSYVGVGKTYLREIGGTTGFLHVGNASVLNFGVTEETKELKDYTQPGGGTYNESKRISAVECTINMHDLNPENLARAIYGSTSSVVAATVTDESHAAVMQGSFVPTTFLPSSITAVKVGAVAKAEGTDYEERPGGIFIIDGGGIANASTVLITYEKAATDVVEALTTSGKEYELLFDGLNEARSGKKARVRAYRFKPGAAQNLSLIGDDYAVLEVTGKLLKDTTKTGAGISQYFKAEIEV